MAGVRDILTWDNRKTQAMLKRAITHIGDLTPVMKIFGEYMLVQTEQRFVGEHDPDGRPWTPLAPATLRYKKTNKILTESGHRGGLRGTITYQSNKRRMSYGTNKKYGAIHQLGGQAGRNHMVTIPARPYLGITNENMTEFYTIVKDYLEAD